MKTFKKIVALLTSVMMLMSCSVFAATTTASINQADGKVTVTVECGTSKANSPVTVTVFKPASGGYADLSGTDNSYTVTDVNDIISYAYLHTADASGNITFTYIPQAEEDDKYGEYFVRVAGENAGSFSYVTDADKAGIIAELKLNPTAANVESLFAATENNVYTKAERLELDKNCQFYSAVSNANVYAYVANRMSTVTTETDLAVLFDEAVYVSTLNEKSADALLAYIDANKAYSGIETAKAYTDIREVPAVFTSAVKNNALSVIADTDMSNMEIAETNAVITRELVNAVLSYYCDSYGVLDQWIDDFSAEIAAAGGDVATYLASEERLSYADILKRNQTYANMAAFVEMLNSFFTASGTTPPGGIIVDSTQTGNGNNTNISRPTPGTNIFTNNPTQGTNQQTPATGMFTDLSNHEWAVPAIKTLKEKNIINGKNANEFAPDDVVLREEFAKMAMLTVLPNHIESIDGETGFADVSSGEWYAPYIVAANKNGVITGFDGSFGTGNTIRREDMAVMCYRAIKAAGINLAEERADHQFTDAISDYAKEAISAMYKAGLINGYSETEFNASGTATRAEAAVILYNIIQKYM